MIQRSRSQRAFSLFLAVALGHVALYLLFWFAKTNGYAVKTLQNYVDAGNYLDVGFYLEIAQNGYSADGRYSEVLPVFFPLFPALIALGAKVTGLATGAAAFVVQRVLCVMMMLMLAIWMRVGDPRGAFGSADRHDGSAADRLKRSPWLGLDTFLFLVVQPAAIFVVIPYTEALFVTLLAALLVAWRRLDVRETLTRAPASFFECCGLGLLAFLLALTRPTGIFLAPACGLAGLLFFLQGEGIKHLRKLACIVAGVLLAVACYATYLGIVVGDPFVFYTARAKGWPESPSLLNLFKVFVIPLGSRDMLRHIVALLALFGTFLLWRKKRIFEFSFCALFLILPLIQGKLPDMARFSFVCFPAWYALHGTLKARPVALAMVTTLFSLGALSYVFQWLGRHWVG